MVSYIVSYGFTLIPFPGTSFLGLVLAHEVNVSVSGGEGLGLEL